MVILDQQPVAATLDADTPGLPVQGSVYHISKLGSRSNDRPFKLQTKNLVTDILVNTVSKCMHLQYIKLLLHQ